MEEVRHSRFKGAPWYTEDLGDTNVTIGGAGGIGSWLAFFLYKIGVAVRIVDTDRLEEHNLGGQLMSAHNLGGYKVDAVRNMIQLTEANSYVSNFYGEKDWITEEYRLRTDHVFSGFDNMTARKALFNAWVKKCFELGDEEYTPKPGYEPIFIDGRLEMEQIQIFTITNHAQIVKYRAEHLFDDEEVEEAACTMKQTSHTAAMIGAKMTAIYTNFLSNLNTGANSRTVPFYYEEFTPALLNTVEI
tara:strand:+ start:1508 stop:2242 length:735 start_codon:yes stop_codon:yes gene_type:complete